MAKGDGLESCWSAPSGSGRHGRSERGVLIVLASITVALAASYSVFLWYAVKASQTTNELIEKREVYYIARAGLAEALREINDASDSQGDSPGDGLGMVTQASALGGEYQVTATPDGIGGYTIDVWAMMNDTEIRLQGLTVPVSIAVTGTEMTSAFRYGIYTGRGLVQLAQYTQTDSWSSTDGWYGALLGTNSYVGTNGDIGSNSDVYLETGVIVRGDLYYGTRGTLLGGDYELEAGAVVWGDKIQNTQSSPSFTIPWPSSNNNAVIPSIFLDTTVSPPGLRIDATTGNLTLPAGTYYFSSVIMFNAAQLQFAGDSEVFVKAIRPLYESENVPYFDFAIEGTALMYSAAGKSVKLWMDTNAWISGNRFYALSLKPEDFSVRSNGSRMMFEGTQTYIFGNIFSKAWVRAQAGVATAMYGSLVTGSAATAPSITKYHFDVELKNMTDPEILVPVTTSSTETYQAMASVSEQAL